MKKFIRFLLTAVLICGLAVLLWLTSRPVSLTAEELNPAETMDSYPGADLSLEIDDRQIRMIFSNRSDTLLESGAGINQSQKLLFDAGLDILLDDRWYAVPFREYSTAGVGLEIKPGDTVEGEAILSPYGRLPDGQYRISLGYWRWEPDDDSPLSQQPYYESYALFNIEEGNYISAA